MEHIETALPQFTPTTAESAFKEPRTAKILKVLAMPFLVVFDLALMAVAVLSYFAYFPMNPTALNVRLVETLAIVGITSFGVSLVLMLVAWLYMTQHPAYRAWTPPEKVNKIERWKSVHPLPRFAGLIALLMFTVLLTGVFAVLMLEVLFHNPFEHLVFLLPVVGLGVAVLVGIICGLIYFVARSKRIK